MASQACLQAKAVQEDAEALIKALEEHLFETTTPGYVLREMFQKKQSSTEIIDDLHFNNKTSLDYSLKGQDRDYMIDLILTQTLIMHVQNQKLVKILIDNQDKSFKHVLKEARDWEFLHKQTDNIQEQSGKTLNAMSTYRAGNKNQAFQNQNQHGQKQGNGSSENFGNRSSRSESRNRGHGREGRSKSRQRNQNNPNQTSYRGRKCGRSGKDLHQKPEQCPAIKSKCD
jgi:hypothetical protein